MTRLRILIARVKSFFATREQDLELNEELHAHLEFLVEEKRRQGMTEEEARRAASLHFGGIAQTEETYREARGLHFLLFPVMPASCMACLRFRLAVRRSGNRL